MTSSGFSLGKALAPSTENLYITAMNEVTSIVKARKEQPTASSHKTTKGKVSAVFRTCKDMPWKGKGVKKKKLNCFRDLARSLESGGSEVFIACKKKNFIRDKKNCFRDLARLLQN